MAAWTRLAASVSVAVLALTGCTYSSSEPGLFPSPESTSMAPPPRRNQFPPQRTNPKLPVAGERIWVSGAQIPVTMRIAVHAVRRVAGATVLDWSITPLHAEGFRLGDALPGIELGLDRPARGGYDPAVALLDPAGAHAYRPLAHQSRRLFNHCLCTPIWVVAQSLRIGETRLLQIAFPALPGATNFIDVSMATVTPFAHVPVSPAGTAPVADGPTDLARAAESPKPLPQTVGFHNPAQADQVQRIAVNHIWTAPGRTTLEWTLSSVTDQSFSQFPQYGPPVTGPQPPPDVFLVNTNPASGPVLAASAAGGRKRLTASSVVTQGNNIVGYECLCTELGLWSTGLRNAGGSVGLVTNYPALPPRTLGVDVELPGYGVFRKVPVSPVEDAARHLRAPQPVETGLWNYVVEDPPRGWSTTEWPTDVPDPTQLSAYRPAVETVRALPGVH
jgi:hypothetical protein